MASAIASARRRRNPSVYARNSLERNNEALAPILPSFTPTPGGSVNLESGLLSIVSRGKQESGLLSGKQGSGLLSGTARSGATRTTENPLPPRAHTVTFQEPTQLQVTVDSRTESTATFDESERRDRERQLLEATIALFHNAGVRREDLRSIAVPEATEGEEAGSEAASNRTIEIPDWPDWRNKVRRLCLESVLFERFLLVIILLNCLVLAMEDPLDVDCLSSRCKFTRASDYVFTVFFTLECIVKIVGLTFQSRPDAYIRDRWNALDFLIVVSGDAAFVLDVVFGVQGAGLTALRAFRVLRPLKTIQTFPSVRLLVQSILASLPNLMDVLVLYTFFVLTMGIIAVDQWNGLLRKRCVPEGWDLSWDPLNATTATDPVFRNTAMSEHIYGDRVCQSREPNLGGHYCRWGYKCVETVDNPNNDKIGFDHIGFAMLTLFTAISLEGWTETMYYTMDATTFFAPIFWIVLIIFGSFFILNLTIVIITEAFEQKQEFHRAQPFFAVDKAKTGELQRPEVRQLLERKLGHQVTEEELDECFLAMDADGGGTVTLDEFLRWELTRGQELDKKQKGCRHGCKRFLSTILPYNVLRRAINTMKVVKRRIAEEYHKERVGNRLIVYKVVGAEEKNAGEYAVMNKRFRRFIIGAILLNTCVLGTEHYRQPDWLTDLQTVSNVVFTLIFLAEALIKIYGLGLVGYLADSFNVFDLVVVALSVVDLLSSGEGTNVSVFRSFRVLRVLKLTHQFPSLQRWVHILASSLRNAAVLTGLIALLVFIVALLGMQLFGGQFCFLDADWDPESWQVTPEQLVVGHGCGGVPRSNYDTLWWAFITTFQILTGEDWNLVMYNGMRSRGNGAAVYFLIYYVVGNYLMLNLFIAVLLNNRGLQMDEQPEKDKRRDLAFAWWDPQESTSRVISDGELSGALPDGTVQQKEKWLCLKQRVQSELRFGLYSKESMLSVQTTRLIESTLFDGAVIIAITVSSVSLALENPHLPPDHWRQVLVHRINLILIWVFLGEILVKSIGYGAFLHADSFWRRDKWNRLDLFIVVCSLLSLTIPEGSAIGATISVMRTLRPLRFINRSTGMKVAVGAILKSLGPLVNVLIISFLLFLIFAIMGVQLFAGQFYRCTMYDYGDREAPAGVGMASLLTEADCLNKTLCPDEVTEGVRVACQWVSSRSDFDHAAAAMLTLYTMASLEGWVDVMHLGVDARGTELAPVANENPAAATFFLVFITFGSFFIVNMFIGVLIDTYYKEKDKMAETGGFLLLNEDQRKWVESHRRILKTMSQMEAGRSELQFDCLECVLSPMFERVILFLIVLNVLAMASEHYPASDAYQDAMRFINIAFVTIFAVEAFIKILAFGFKVYVRNPWNRFDFAL
eukprot:Hpha_TRINITY_DN10472_c0_g2::TRINITY_DN10472_c0_g2_i1::g.193251::m.193251/K04857/CACNA1S; voltage-dependent calcium channel L type alpha-1S